MSPIKKRGLSISLCLLSFVSQLSQAADPLSLFKGGVEAHVDASHPLILYFYANKSESVSVLQFQGTTGLSCSIEEYNKSIYIAGTPPLQFVAPNSNIYRLFCSKFSGEDGQNLVLVFNSQLG